VRTLLVGDCEVERTYDMTDPDGRSESEFEYIVARALSCMYSAYQCIVFNGGFRYDNTVFRPDLALVAKDRSHWFVIEVELVSHSFDGHVFPQVKAFEYGTPEPDCVTVLARELAIGPQQARTMLDFIPRGVAVIANRQDDRWRAPLKAHNVQMLIASVFRSPTGAEAVELDGELVVVAKSLGFGAYSATDRSLRFPRTVDIPRGEIVIDDNAGAFATWNVVESGDGVWITKNHGVPGIIDGTYVQMVRTIDGRLLLRQP
jgi:hypothetical protein